ncbi:MAG: neutral zinc metallopeptidase [Sinobacteraceae bacterium]|nr:neutral zinc metallopeptidase [Nevskiaceae bacterium]
MDDQEESQNIQDDRGSTGGFRPIHGISLGTLAVALIGGWLLGINPLTILGLLSGGGVSAPQSTSQSAPSQPYVGSPQEEAQKKFVSQILRSTETVWSTALQERGQSYQPTTLVLYRGGDRTACGEGEAAAGPFYCPNDRKVYLDLSFFDLMTQQLGAPGQFAHAYVVAHEVGHHVQNLLGILGRVDERRQRGSEAQANALSVRLELQADCLAGVWATRSQSQQHGWHLDQGDVATALQAASQIGDDTLQKRSRGVVVPESFTHGTSAQRVSWFKRGVDSGQIDSCDTFAAAQL